MAKEKFKKLIYVFNDGDGDYSAYPDFETVEADVDNGTKVAIYELKQVKTFKVESKLV